jgi:hypothetical protein
MDFREFSFWLLCGSITSIGLIVWHFLSSLILEIRLVRQEMADLNQKMATVVTNLDWHGKELSKLDSRLTMVEKKGE